jgi:hypothetical protein
MTTTREKMIQAMADAGRPGFVRGDELTSMLAVIGARLLGVSLTAQAALRLHLEGDPTRALATLPSWEDIHASCGACLAELDTVVVGAGEHFPADLARAIREPLQLLLDVTKTKVE